MAEPEIYLKAYDTVAEARAGIKEWMRFYNADRTHQSLDKQTPEKVYFNQPIEEMAAELTIHHKSQKKYPVNGVNL